MLALVPECVILMCAVWHWPTKGVIQCLSLLPLILIEIKNNVQWCNGSLALFTRCLSYK